MLDYDPALMMKVDAVHRPEYDMYIHIFWSIDIETYVSYVYVGVVDGTINPSPTTNSTCLGPFYGYSPVFWRSADRKAIKGAMLGGEDELQSSSSEEE